MTGGMFYEKTERQQAGYPTYGQVLWDWLFDVQPPMPVHIAPGLRPIEPFDLTCTTTSQILTPVSNTPNNFRRVYYMVISIKSMSQIQPQTVFISFKQSQSAIQLNNYNSFYEWAAVPGETLDLSGLAFSVDHDTAVITISGVSY